MPRKFATTVLLEQEQSDKLRALTAATSIPQSEHIRAALDRYFVAIEAETAPRKPAGHAADCRCFACAPKRAVPLTRKHVRTGHAPVFIAPKRPESAPPPNLTENQRKYRNSTRGKLVGVERRVASEARAAIAATVRHIAPADEQQRQLASAARVSAEVPGSTPGAGNRERGPVEGAARSGGAHPCEGPAWRCW